MHALPFGRPGRFHRGNPRTHSTNSDGSHEVGRVRAAYREAGYDFLTLPARFMEDDGDDVAVRCSPARAISIMVRASKSASTMGEAMTDATFPIRRFKGSWSRVTVIDGDGRRAWSNPVWLD